MRGLADRLPWDLDWGDKASAPLQRHMEPLCIYPQIPNKQCEQWGCSGHGNTRRVTIFSWQGIQLMYNHNDLVTYRNLLLNSQPTMWQGCYCLSLWKCNYRPVIITSADIFCFLSVVQSKNSLGWKNVEKDLQQTFCASLKKKKDGTLLMDRFKKKKKNFISAAESERESFGTWHLHNPQCISTNVRSGGGIRCRCTFKL